MNLDAIILKSLYDYKDGRDPKCLNFEADERFALIKEPDGADWYYVVNSQGQIGYVPKPYVNFDGVRDSFAKKNSKYAMTFFVK